jgi:two-component system, NarL family, response regulator DevR
MTGYVQRSIRVYLMDDHEVVRRGLQDLLESKRDISVVGEGGSAQRAMNVIPRLRPDVMVLDIHLRDGTGVEVCRAVRALEPTVRGLLLTSDDDDEALLSAVVAGAHGYALKEARTLNLVDAIRRVGAGDVLLDKAGTRSLVERMSTLLDSAAHLSPSDMRTLAYVVDGLTGRRYDAPVPVTDRSLEREVAALVPKLTRELSRSQLSHDRRE